MTKSNVGKKGIISLTVTRNSLSEAVRQELSQSWNQHRSWCRCHRGMLPTGLLLIACSACFLLEARTMCLGVALLTMGWGLPHQPLIKKMPYMLAYRPALWAHFLNWGSLFSGYCRLYQVDLKLASQRNAWKKEMCHLKIVKGLLQSSHIFVFPKSELGPRNSISLSGAFCLFACLFL